MKYIKRSAISLIYGSSALAYEYSNYGRFNFKYVVALNSIGLMLSMHSNFNNALKKSIYIACALSALSLPFFLAIGAGVGYLKSDTTEVYSLPTYKFIDGFFSNLAPLVTGAGLGIFLKHDANYEAVIDSFLKFNSLIKEKLEHLKAQIN